MHAFTPNSHQNGKLLAKTSCKEVCRSVAMIYIMHVCCPRYGRSQIWAYIVILERLGVLPIEPRKGDATEFFRDPERIWENG